MSDTNPGVSPEEQQMIEKTEQMSKKIRSAFEAMGRSLREILTVLIAIIFIGLNLITLQNLGIVNFAVYFAVGLIATAYFYKSVRFRFSDESEDVLGPLIMVTIAIALLPFSILTTIGNGIEVLTALLAVNVMILAFANGHFFRAGR